MITYKSCFLGNKSKLFIQYPGKPKIGKEVTQIVTIRKKVSAVEKICTLLHRGHYCLCEKYHSFDKLLTSDSSYYKVVKYKLNMQKIFSMY